MTPSGAGAVRRVIDANLNRAGEGLRFLEEMARLVLNDMALTQQLKTMRHQVLQGDWPFHRPLIAARDAASDVGADLEAATAEAARDLPVAVMANARRVQESLRTLEELAKLPDTTPALDGEKFQKARFDLYTIEQGLLGRLERRQKLEQLAGLYVIIDTAVLGRRAPVEVAARAIRGGARVIQLRDKSLPGGELLALAADLQALCTGVGVLFIVNDRLDIALAADADGLHLGQTDLPAAVARRLLPVDKLLGISAATVEEASAAAEAGADYIAVGAVYATPTKAEAEAVGLERVQQVSRAVDRPLVAIGGINRDNAAAVMTAGAQSVAVISAVVQAGDPEAAAREIVAALEGSQP